jgi:hypothetical protein
MGNKKRRGPIWHDGRLTAIAIGENRDVTLYADLNTHWNGGNFQVGTAYVRRIENFDEARAWLQSLSPSVARPVGVLGLEQDGDDVVLDLNEISFRFRGSRLSHS